MDLSAKSDAQIRNLIDNFEREGAVGDPVYRLALAEMTRRTVPELDPQKTFARILEAARERRFLSYKELAEASGAPWQKVRHKIGRHLWHIVHYAHCRGWPMLSAIVVNKTHLHTGKMDPDTLKGFVAAAEGLGHAVQDGRDLLKAEQERVFAWAAEGRPAEYDAPAR